MSKSKYQPVTAERLCVFCVHMDSDYDPGSNCPTCGYGPTAGMRCEQGHWNWTMSEWAKINDYRKAILKAVQCPDFEQVKP